jgi:hydroxymethylpyrimidine/phosphomethylpyrimidine kinase
MKGRVLIVAGSDSGGGAGIQADIKTVTALGGYAMTAITALTAQDTNGVHGIHDVPADFVVQQMKLCLADIGADCIKLGMLHRADVIEAVASVIGSEAKGIPLVVDPVMVAKGGHALLATDAERALIEKILPRATVLTPNLPEAEALTGVTVADVGTMTTAATKLAALGAGAVLIKGGHLEGDKVIDLLLTRGGTHRFENPRIKTAHTHGTGCTLASAIATGLAQGLEIVPAVERARAYVQEAIRTAPGYGHGHGPLNHGHTVRLSNPG